MLVIFLVSNLIQLSRCDTSNQSSVKRRKRDADNSNLSRRNAKDDDDKKKKRKDDDDDERTTIGMVTELMKLPFTIPMAIPSVPYTVITNAISAFQSAPAWLGLPYAFFSIPYSLIYAFLSFISITISPMKVIFQLLWNSPYAPFSWFILVLLIAGPVVIPVGIGVAVAFFGSPAALLG